MRGRPSPLVVEAVVSVEICSLINKEPQEIPPGGYYMLRFPYGDAESYDKHSMHAAEKKDT